MLPDTNARCIRTHVLLLPVQTCSRPWTGWPVPGPVACCLLLLPQPRHLHMSWACCQTPESIRTCMRLQQRATAACADMPETVHKVAAEMKRLHAALMRAVLIGVSATFTALPLAPGPPAQNDEPGCASTGSVAGASQPSCPLPGPYIVACFHASSAHVHSTTASLMPVPLWPPTRRHSYSMPAVKPPGGH